MRVEGGGGVCGRGWGERAVAVWLSGGAVVEEGAVLEEG